MKKQSEKVVSGHYTAKLRYWTAIRNGTAIAKTIAKSGFEAAQKMRVTQHQGVTIEPGPHIPELTEHPETYTDEMLTGKLHSRAPAFIMAEARRRILEKASGKRNLSTYRLQWLEGETWKDTSYRYDVLSVLIEQGTKVHYDGGCELKLRIVDKRGKEFWNNDKVTQAP